MASLAPPVVTRPRSRTEEEKDRANAQDFQLRTETFLWWANECLREEPRPMPILDLTRPLTEQEIVLEFRDGKRFCWITLRALHAISPEQKDNIIGALKKQERSNPASQRETWLARFSSIADLIHARKLLKHDATQFSYRDFLDWSWCLVRSALDEHLRREVLEDANRMLKRPSNEQFRQNIIKHVEQRHLSTPLDQARIFSAMLNSRFPDDQLDPDLYSSRSKRDIDKWKAAYHSLADETHVGALSQPSLTDIKADSAPYFLYLDYLERNYRNDQVEEEQRRRQQAGFSSALKFDDDDRELDDEDEMSDVWVMLAAAIIVITILHFLADVSKLRLGTSYI